MPDVFISHSTQDSQLAQRIYREIQLLGGTAFLAPISIEPGKKWGQDILNNLIQAKVVLFLASRAACASPYVNQELGGAITLNKRIVPVIWEISSQELPGWMNQFQAVDVQKGLEQLLSVLDSTVKKLKLDREQTGLMLAGLALVLLLILSKEK